MHHCCITVSSQPVSLSGHNCANSGSFTLSPPTWFLFVTVQIWHFISLISIFVKVTRSRVSFPGSVGVIGILEHCITWFVSNLVSNCVNCDLSLCSDHGHKCFDQVSARTSEALWPSTLCLAKCLKAQLYSAITLFLCMTPCEVAWWYHSRSVTKNLTPYRFNSAGWGLYGQNAEIHSFPTMYIMVGVNEVEMGQNNDFLPKNGLKIAFLSITILDHPTSDWAGTQNFKGIAKFNMCFKNNGI